jgi:hypothetical protein
MNASIRTIITAVASALAISFLTYTFGSIMDVFFKRANVTVQRTMVLDATGYLFQIDNDTGSAFDIITITVTRPLKIAATSADNGVRIQTKTLPSFTSIDLSDIPPHRRTNFFIATADQILMSDLSVLHKGASYSIEDKDLLGVSYFNFSNFINALVQFAIVTLLYIWAGSRHEAIGKQIDDFKKESAELHEDERKHRQEYDQKTADLEGKVALVQARHLRLRLVLQRRINELTTENDMWRKCFVAVYNKLLSSSVEAERAMTIILEKLGLSRGGRKLRDIPEGDFIDFLFDEQIVEKWKKLP